jgi:hypothetical protein
MGYSRGHVLKTQSSRTLGSSTFGRGYWKKNSPNSSTRLCVLLITLPLYTVISIGERRGAVILDDNVVNIVVGPPPMVQCGVYLLPITMLTSSEVRIVLELHHLPVICLSSRGTSRKIDEKTSRCRCRYSRPVGVLKTVAIFGYHFAVRQK